MQAARVLEVKARSERAVESMNCMLEWVGWLLVVDCDG